MEEDSPYDIPIARQSGRLAINPLRVRDAITRTLRRHGTTRARISVALVDDRRIAEVNEQYLGHQGPTDVLSFDLSGPESEGIDGELVISVETASREAAARGHEPDAEALLYAIHGTLHLIGLDDDTDENAAGMHAIEDDILTELGVGAVYGSEKP